MDTSSVSSQMVAEALIGDRRVDRRVGVALPAERGSVTFEELWVWLHKVLLAEPELCYQN